MKIEPMFSSHLMPWKPSTDSRICTPWKPMKKTTMFE